MGEKLCVFLIDSEKEAKIRARILTILSRKVKGVTNAVRYGEFHKMVGCSIRAAYFKYLLECMQEEELIMMHWRSYTAKQQGGDCWALWDHPENIRLRDWREQCRREQEEAEIAWQNSPSGRAEKARREAERIRRAQERFNSRLREFLLDNEDDLFELLRRLFIAYMPERDWSDELSVSAVSLVND